MEARILSPQDASFDVISATPPPPQAQQPDVHNLVIRLRVRSEPVRVAVLLYPVGSSAAPALEPLDHWISAGKLDR